MTNAASRTTNPPPASEEAIAGAEATGPFGVFPLLTAAARLATQAPALASAGTRLAGELARVALGRSEVAPTRGDWRFTDPTWTEHPGYHRLMQAYLATCGSLTDLVEEADFDDWRQRERARFGLTMLTTALAPTNTLPGNPAALKRTLETGGVNLLRGFRNYLTDLRRNNGLPSQVDRSEFVPGKDVALTPGAVVYRDEVLELLQYRPTTPNVQVRPIVMVPPQINKYYVLDLAPGRSMIEYAVSRGLTVFVISWRNPTGEQRDWGLDTYATSILAAIDAAREITGSADVHAMGLCAGGITLATVLNRLAATADGRVASASFAVTLLDWDVPAQIGAFAGPQMLGISRWRARRGGVLDGQSMASVFTWMRPNDLVWNYWVNNYLMGNKPKPFDILAWNDDKTNLPTTLHSQFLQCFASNALVHPGELTVLGSPVDLSQIKIETYVTGATTDHITPWRGCYRSTQLFGGQSVFVLSGAGHVQTLVAPIDNPKAKYWVGPEPGPDPDEWRAVAQERQGSWWEHWADWVVEHAGAERAAPGRLGSRAHPPLGDAPGTYVHVQS